METTAAAKLSAPVREPQPLEELRTHLLPRAHEVEAHREKLREKLKSRQGTQGRPFKITVHASGRQLIVLPRSYSDMPEGQGKSQDKFSESGLSAIVKDVQ